MNLSQACLSFELDIHAFVDHELDRACVERLKQHLDACDGCRGFVDDLRQLSDLVVHHAASADQALAASVDEHRVFGGVMRTLLVDKREELARLFYELGRAYVLEANKLFDGRGPRTRNPRPQTQPLDIARTSDRVRRLAHETEEFASATLVADRTPRRSGSLFRQSLPRGLFEGTPSGWKAALVRGQRFLHEALALRPAFDEARIYVGFSHLVDERYDRARVELRRVYQGQGSAVNRLLALQWLGLMYARLAEQFGSRADLLRAIECYEEIVAHGAWRQDGRLFGALVNLAINCAKAGLVERSARHFAEIPAQFPTRVDEIRGHLDRMTDFQALLRQRPDVHDVLCRTAPALFAA